MPRALRQPERRSLWIPWVFVGAMALVVAVNGVLVVASIRTFSGVDIERPYERGRGYDAVLAEAARQDALGWRAELRLADARSLEIVVRDREGRPVKGQLEGLLRRPAEAGEVALDPVAIAPGRWFAPIEARRGQWDARLTLLGADGARFEIRQRIVLP